MVEQLSYQLVAIYSHDSTSFTQGLAWADGNLYESTGIYGKSRLTQRKMSNNQLINAIQLDDNYFGEGVAVTPDYVYQLTWREGVILVYHLSDLRLSHQLQWDREGWGLCYDGDQHLIISDGTSQLYFLNLAQLRVIKQLTVRDIDDQPIDRLNDLEYRDGQIYANQLGSNHLLIVNADTGQVTKQVNLSALCQMVENYSQNQQVRVCNGICYCLERQTWLATGKHWPFLFEIKIN